VYNGAATIGRVVDEIMQDIGERVHFLLKYNRDQQHLAILRRYPSLMPL
jgi:hypothetical protein